MKDDSQRATFNGLNDLTNNIARLAWSGKHGEIGEEDAGRIHQILMAEKLGAKATELEECAGCETGCDADSAHTFSTGCCLADDIEASRPPAFVSKPSPLSGKDRTHARAFDPRSVAGGITVEAEETSEEEPEAPAFPYHLRVNANLTFRQKVQRLERRFELDAERREAIEEGNIADVLMLREFAGGESEVSDTVDTDSDWDPVDEESELEDSDWDEVPNNTDEEDAEVDAEIAEALDNDHRRRLVEDFDRARAHEEEVSELVSEMKVEEMAKPITKKAGGPVHWDGTKRKRTAPKRFADEVEHMPAGWGGAAGSNNGFTRGRDVDMGHSTEDLVGAGILRDLARKDRT